MSYVIHNLKKTQEYKKIRSIFNHMFGTPDYRDNFKNGVSFKWYFTNMIKSRISNYKNNDEIGSQISTIQKYLNNCLLSFELEMIKEIKILPSPIYVHPYGRSYGYESLRILMRFQQEK